jgi:uncharacterized protein (TIGR03545 family)
MIRWSYLLPRLLMVAVLVSAYWFGLNPLARWGLVHTAQRITSAKVDLSEAQVSLVGGRIQLTGLQVANPQRPLKNLLAADRLELDLDTAALLRRRLIVDDAQAIGLRVDTDRDTSGAWQPSGELDLSLPGKELLAEGGRRLAELGRQWLEHVASGLQQELAREVERLEAVRTVREMAQRWPRECQDLESQADGLRLRIERTRNAFSNPPPNPLESLQFYRQVTGELETIERDVVQIQRQCQQLPQQVARDRDAVAAAVRRDRDELRRRFRLDDIRSEQLSEYLLERELGEKVVTVTRWIRWISRQRAADSEPPEPERSRGVDVVPAHPTEPDFLVRFARIEGRAWCDGRSYDFLATVRGLTSQPKVLRQPMVIRAQVQVPAEMWIEATLDRSGTEPHDQIVMQCPAWVQPSRTLGNPEQVALAVSPGATSFGLELELRGSRVVGRLQVFQEPVELLPIVGPRCGGSRVAGVLQTALRPLRRLEAQVQLCGTANQPEWRLESNLGRQLATGISTALCHELDARCDQLLAELQRRVEQELSGVEQKVADKQQQLLAKLEGAIGEARQVGGNLAQRLTLPVNLPGGLPTNLPWR